jgi:hypothetical protein
VKSKQSNQSLFAGIVYVPKTHGSKAGATCGKNTRAYECGDQFDKRVQIMAGWANLVNTINALEQNVVAIRGVA